MWANNRSAILTVGVIVLALVLGLAFVNGKVQRSRQSCVDRGGQVVIQSDPMSIGQYCVFPSGSREPI
jgi:regulatory protein YycI of two-component signal transduction system YycFG